MLKQHLLLYSSIPLPKLASLLDLDQAALRTQLLCLKNKSYWWVGLAQGAGAGLRGGGGGHRSVVWQARTSPPAARVGASALGPRGGDVPGPSRPL